MQRTLVILKPRLLQGECWNPGELTFALERGLETIGGRMTWMRTIVLTPEMVQKIYPHVREMDFYPDMEKLYTGGRSYIQIWEGPQIIRDMRGFVGCTIGPARGTMRFRFGNRTVSYDNAIHCSDSEPSFLREYAVIHQCSHRPSAPDLLLHFPC